ncbi:MAG: hypothetical protein ACLFNP_12670 [Spirochaetaceae bacterium]
MNGKLFYGDIHNHCNISYAHGNLSDALENARQRLDFCSVTGHAHWTDIPERNERTDHIVDFHERGFEKLKSNWRATLETLRVAEEPGSFLTFPGFEVHSSAHGDRAIVYRDPQGELLYPETIPALHRQLRELSITDGAALALPHHIGYHRGARGINWESFDEKVSPVVEIFSMHGAAETTEGPLPFLHSMGPADSGSTVREGLAQGHVFGFVANTDHHSAHPGSYGHGMHGVWATALSREAIWQALFERRTFALTGDKIRLDYSIGEAPMGAIRPHTGPRELFIELAGGAPIDYVDLIHNNRLIRRITPVEMARPDAIRQTRTGWIRSKIYLEVGWGPRGKPVPWTVEFGIEEGRVLDVEPRFRGPDVLSPEQEADSEGGAFYSWCRPIGDRSVHFETRTYGNPTTSTPGTQGVCLEVEMPRNGKVHGTLNGTTVETTMERLIAGGKSGHLRHEIDSPAWLLHRVPEAWELYWTIREDAVPELAAGDFLYTRVRQQNNQWAWGSPVFVR